MAKGSGKAGYFLFAEAVWKSDLKAHSKLILLAYAEFHDWTNSNGAFPSHNTLHKITGLSKNTVIRHTAELEKAGWLINAGRHYFDKGYTQIYDLTIPKYAVRLPKYEATIPNSDSKMGTKQIHITDTYNKDIKQIQEQIQHPMDAVSLDGKPKGLSEENPYINILNNIKNFLLVSHRAGTAHIREKE